MPESFPVAVAELEEEKKRYAVDRGGFETLPRDVRVHVYVSAQAISTPPV